MKILIFISLLLAINKLLWSILNELTITKHDIEITNREKDLNQLVSFAKSLITA
jgi:hypothetical protein